jgi:hypothetical protein
MSNILEYHDGSPVLCGLCASVIFPEGAVGAADTIFCSWDCYQEAVEGYWYIITSPVTGPYVVRAGIVAYYDKLHGQIVSGPYSQEKDAKAIVAQLNRLEEVKAFLNGTGGLFAHVHWDLEEEGEQFDDYPVDLEQLTHIAWGEREYYIHFSGFGYVRNTEGVINFVLYLQKLTVLDTL